MDRFSFTTVTLVALGSLRVNTAAMLCASPISCVSKYIESPVVKMHRRFDAIKQRWCGADRDVARNDRRIQDRGHLPDQSVGCLHLVRIEIVCPG